MKWIALCALALAAGPAAADSLWNAANARTGSLVADRKARQAGDLLTVVVVETAQATQQASTQSDKKATAAVNPSTGLMRFLPTVGISNSQQYAGQGATSRSTTLNARMTVQVVRVQPDGTLEIEGRRSVVVNQEQQELVLTGRVRPDDVGPDNTILSSLVANAQITYTGKGTVRHAQKPGIITRILRIFF